MKKFIPLIFCAMILFSSCNVTERLPVLYDNFQCEMSFNIDDTEYKGNLTVTDYNNMQFALTEPKEISGLEYMYSNGEITAVMEDTQIISTDKMNNSCITLFFNCMKKILSTNCRCNKLNGMYVYSADNCTLYADENCVYDRLVCGNKTFIFSR